MHSGLKATKDTDAQGKTVSFVALSTGANIAEIKEPEHRLAHGNNVGKRNFPSHARWPEKRRRLARISSCGTWFSIDGPARSRQDGASYFSHKATKPQRCRAGREAAFPCHRAACRTVDNEKGLSAQAVFFVASWLCANQKSAAHKARAGQEPFKQGQR